VIHLHFTAADLSRIRFAASPLWETVTSLRALGAERHGEHLHRAWCDRIADRMRDRLSEGDLELLTALVRPAGYIPDFLSPPPRRRSISFEEELAEMAEADPDVVARELAHLAGHRVAQRGPGRTKRRAILQALVDRPDAGIGPVTDALDAYHRVAIAADWPRIEALLRDDLAYRLQALADGGVDQMMRDLHPSVTFVGETLKVVKYYEGHADLGGRGLLLVPCAFAWPDVIVRTAQPGVPTVSYSPRGLGRLWEEHPASPDAALSDVLGRTRAALLTQLDLPMSTTQAATQLALSAPTLSVHLQALRAAGLLTSRRDGRQVLYARTDLGDRLLAGAQPSARASTIGRA
jgi:DNA-binding transcriptional ArsR family regulator